MRAFALMATVLDASVVAPLVRTLTKTPVVDVARLGRVPVEIVRPGGAGPWPTWVFLSGAHPERRREPVVRRLTEGLARAGYLVVVPDPPGLAEGEITPETLAATVAATRAAVELDGVRSARVALLGASTGASLALLAAADAEIAELISVVVAAVPFADVEKIVCLATTCAYLDEGAFAAYPANELLRRIVMRSLAAAVSQPEAKTILRRSLDDVESGRDPHALDALARRLDLDPEARCVARLLSNTDSSRFGELYAALPANVVATVRELSPLAVASQVRAPVEIVVPPSDEYFPLGEALALAGALRDARLTVTATLDHTRPAASLRNAASLLAFQRFVVRGLAAALS